MGEACGSCGEGRAVLGTRQKKIQRRNICATLGEPPDADPHVRWCERERLAAAPYSILRWKTSMGCDVFSIDVLSASIDNTCHGIHGIQFLDHFYMCIDTNHHHCNTVHDSHSIYPSSFWVVYFPFVSSSYKKIA